MHHRKLSKSYADWIDTLILDYSEKHRVSWQPTESYIQCNGYFVTFSFDRYAISRRKSASNERSTTDLSPEFFNVDLIYKRVCRSLLGRKYFRYPGKQPLMIGAADVNGTRFDPRPDQIENVHIHSFWLLQPGQSTALAAEIEKAKADPTLDIRDIHVVACTGLDRTTGNPSRLSSYMTKFIGTNTLDMRVIDDLLIYPRRGNNGTS